VSAKKPALPAPRVPSAKTLQGHSDKLGQMVAKLLGGKK
jgi:hypothetical protein